MTVRRISNRLTPLPSQPRPFQGTRKPAGSKLAGARHIPYVPVTQNEPSHGYEVIGPKGPEYINRAQLESLIRQRKLLTAVYPPSKIQYYVLEEAAGRPEHVRNIYEFERLTAAAEMRTRTDAVDRETLENLLEVTHSYVTRQNPKPENLRHLAFMLREAAEAGGDLLLGIALLLHNSHIKAAGKFLRQQKFPKSYISDAVKICETFKKMNSFCYSPSRRHVENRIHDTIDALIKLSGGNWRTLLMFAAHKLSSLVMDDVSREDIALRSITEIYAPLCERYGLRSVAQRLKFEAFRLHEPVRHQGNEAEIQANLGMPRDEAEFYLAGLEGKLAAHFNKGPYDLHLSFSRVKTGEAAQRKSEYKPEEYPEILLMVDLLAATIITERPVKPDYVGEEVKQALGNDFKSLSTEPNQLELKPHEIGGRTYHVHHLGVLLNGGNDLEIQLMDRETFEAIERGSRAHWVYKTELITDEKFHRSFLDAIAPRLTGEIGNDLMVTYEALNDWIFPHIQVKDGIITKRYKKGALPFDVFTMTFGPEANYHGALKGKLWRKNVLSRAAEDVPVDDGDVLAFARAGEARLSPLLRPVYPEARRALADKLQGNRTARTTAADRQRTAKKKKSRIRKNRA